jgi:hypothetical protein
MNGKNRSATSATPSDSTSGRSDSPRRGGAEDDLYTLRIVFSGIVPLVPEFDEDGTPKTFWVLVSNLTDPARLPSLPNGNGHGHDHDGLIGHRNRLLVSRGHFRSAVGREIRQGEVCEEDQLFDFVELDNEHLTLEADSPQTTLEIIEGQIRPPVPCDKGTTNFDVVCDIDRPRGDQERDFQWTVSVDTIAAGLTKQGQRPPRIRKELFDTSYRAQGFPLISARLAFDRGTVTARKLDREPGGEFRVYTVPPPEGATPFFLQAVCTQTELVLPVRGPVTFRSRALDGSARDRQPIIIENLGASEVTVFVENEPDVACTDGRRRGPHFVANFLLLDRPEVLQALVGPEDTSPVPSLNGQCSPPKFAFPA